MSLFDNTEAGLPGPTGVDIFSLPRSDTAVDLVLDAAPNDRLDERSSKEVHVGADSARIRQDTQTVQTAVDMPSGAAAAAAAATSLIGSAFTPVSQSDGSSLTSSPGGSGNSTSSAQDAGAKRRSMVGSEGEHAADGTYMKDKVDSSNSTSSETKINRGCAVPTHKIQVVTVQYTEKEKRERKYECKHCKKRFTRPSSLTSHVYTHTGEKPFACDFPNCTKRFSVLSNLRRHYKVHTHRRSYGAGGRVRSATIPSPISGSGDISAHDLGIAGLMGLPPPRPYMASGRPQQYAAGFAGRNRFNTFDSDDRSSYLPPGPLPAVDTGSTPLSLASQKLFGYAPSFRTTALLQPGSSQMGAYDGSADIYGTNDFLQAQLFPGIQCASSISSTAATAATSGSASANGTATATPSPTSNSSSGLTGSTINCLDSAAFNGCTSATTAGNLDGAFPPVPLQANLLVNPCAAHFGQSSIWPLAIGIPPSAPAAAPSSAQVPESASALSALTAAAASATAADAGISINSAFSNIFQKTPVIATPAIATNSSVTTKAMNGGIESSTNTCNSTMSPLSFVQPKHGPLALLDFVDPQLPPAGVSGRGGFPAGIGSVGGMVSVADSLLDSLSTGQLSIANGGSSRCSRPGSTAPKVSDSMWQLLQASHSLYNS